MNEFFGALLAAAVAAFVSYFISNRDLSDSLDTKSGWRAKLFDVASKYELTLDDAQTVRAALRIFPQRKKVEQYSFTWFSNVMIVHLDKYILNEDYSSKILKGQENKPNRKNVHKFKNLSLMTTEEISDLNTSVLNVETTKVVRLFTMFLLKYHFDYRSSMGAKDYLLKANKDKNKRYNSLVEETYVQYKKLMEKSMCKKNINEDQCEVSTNGVFIGKISKFTPLCKAIKKININPVIKFGFIFSVTFFILLIIQERALPQINETSSSVEFVNLNLVTLFQWREHPVLIAFIILSLVISITTALLFFKIEWQATEKSNNNDETDETNEVDELINLWDKRYKKQPY